MTAPDVVSQSSPQTAAETEAPDQVAASGQEDQLSLERALDRTEKDAEQTLKAAASVTSALKRVRTAAHVGDLRALNSSFDAAEQALTGLRQALANARLGWDFDEEAYFSSGAYPQELLQMARQMDVRIYEQDERLYSYPSLVRVLPNDRAVLIDKTRERRLRPSVLVSHLRDLQKQPPRFRPEAFLEALYDAYSVAVDAAAGRRKDDLVGVGTAVRLLDLYGLFTLMPGQAREYSRQEFARDVYLLDQSGVRTTRRGMTVSFPASTGTRGQAGAIRVITQSGQEKLYYGVAFHTGT